ncbi:hypothetical protein PM082_004358 [Marasmius tenuissimus]|nr:hypothetical protein PM082_004358 [Marasmius tenuissimus]
MHPFDSLLNLAPIYNNPSVAREAVKQAKDLIPSFVESWVSGIKKHMLNKLFIDVNKDNLPPDIDPLQLAINVFCCSCDQGVCLIGWEDVVQHMHYHRRQDLGCVSFRIEWSHDEFRAVCALIEELGLNRYMVSAKDMDRRDARFVCRSCPDIVRRDAWNWREAVAHRVAYTSEGNDWKVLRSPFASLVKRRETYPSHSQDIWVCNHCPGHLDQGVQRAEAIRHVMEEHSIRLPQEELDFFCSPDGTDTVAPRKPIRVPDEAQFICLDKQCKGLRVMNEKSVKRHQRHKHGLEEPKMEVDYTSHLPNRSREIVADDASDLTLLHNILTFDDHHGLLRTFIVVKMPSKRLKTKETTGPRKLRGSRGVLENIQNLPLDVVHEIFGYLHPHDLLRLSRTTKTIRKFVLDRSASHAWRKARERSEVPSIIFRMSEPAFASLLFDTYCRYCKATNIRQIHWHALMRCCKRCQGIHFSGPQELDKFVQNTPSKLFVTIPMIIISKSGSTKYKHIYSNKAAEDLYNHYVSLSPEDQQRWVRERLKEHDAQIEAVAACSLWDKDRKESREAELGAAREQRYEEIVNRLQELGWHRAVVQSPMFRDCSAVKSACRQPITDAAWRKIHSLVENTRDFHEERVRGGQIIRRWSLLNDFLNGFSKTLPLGLVMPHADVIALSEPFRSRIEDPPITSNVILDVSQAQRLELLQQVRSWNEAKTELLLRKLQDHRTEATQADLFLCTTMFSCTQCPRSVYTYPAILSHRCCNRSKIDWGERIRSADTSQVPQDLFLDKIQLHTEALAVTKEFSQVLGQDFSTSSSKLMLMRNPLVQCVECSRILGAKVFIRWSAAVNYAANHTPQHTEFLPASQDDTAVVEDTELDCYGPGTARFGRRRDWFVCKLCDKRDTLLSMEAHLEGEHNITGGRSEIPRYCDFQPLDTVFFIGPDPVLIEN